MLQNYENYFIRQTRILYYKVLTRVQILKKSYLKGGYST